MKRRDFTKIGMLNFKKKEELQKSQFCSTNCSHILIVRNRRLNFSGKTIYHNKFNINNTSIDLKKRIFLDLGIVRNIAIISINSNRIRTFWKPPFALEIMAYCKVDENTIDVEVTNLWPNRMIGNQHEPDDLEWGEVKYFKYVTPNPKIGRNLQKVPDWVKQNKERPSSNRATFTIIAFFEIGDSLLPSGLLGPVEICIEDIVKI